MISRSLAVGLLAAGCLTAAAGGSYLAVRQNAAAEALAEPADARPAPPPAVNETEGVVTPPAAPPVANPDAPAVEAAPAPAPTPAPPSSAAPERRTPPRGRPSVRPAPARASATPTPSAPVNQPVAESTSNGRALPAAGNAPAPVERPLAEPAIVEPAARPVEPTFEEIVIPASSVIGLEIETTVTSEQARIEDRVDARVTRDVYADGRLAIPAGSRVVGAVALVERGGKMKERARLGVRFHTLVLGNGRQAALRTETIYREGDSPSNESSRKIGGAAIGGAVLGAILGGGKGAMAGATVGAAGGTAAVMAGGRNPATLASGSVVTVKLSSPVTMEVEK